MPQDDGSLSNAGNPYRLLVFTKQVNAPVALNHFPFVPRIEPCGRVLAFYLASLSYLNG